MLDGLTVDSINTLKESFDSVNTSEESAQNLTALSKESNKQVVEAVLRGFVIYSVEDVEDDQTVYVTIVSTPKTLGKFSRLSSAHIKAETIQEGISELLNEIKSGLVPPVGGIVVQVNSTGEMAFIGCGSAIIDSSPNKAIQSKLQLTAKRIAAVRAKAALCGMVLANKIWWEGKVDSEQFASL